VAPVFVESELIPCPVDPVLIAAMRLADWLVQTPGRWRRLDAKVYQEVMHLPFEPKLEADALPSFEQFRNEICSRAQLARGRRRHFSFGQGKHGMHTIRIQSRPADGTLWCRWQARWMWRYYRPFLRLRGWRYTGGPW